MFKKITLILYLKMLILYLISFPKYKKFLVHIVITLAFILKNEKLRRKQNRSKKEQEKK